LSSGNFYQVRIRLDTWIISQELMENYLTYMILDYSAKSEGNLIKREFPDKNIG
jgi:hypothetical protein